MFSLIKRHRICSWLIVFALAASSFLLPQAAQAGNLSTRSLTLSTSAPNTAATWAFAFTPSAGAVLKSIRFQVCTTPSNSFSSCTAPGSWANTGATLASVSQGTGWAVDLATNADSLGVKSTTNATSISSALTVTFNTVTNPNATGPFYVRIATYTDATYTTQQDGINSVAAATANQISVSASVNETLTFCSGVTVASNCGSTTGTSVALGSLTTSGTGTGTSQLGAATNGTGGYVITMNGSTLTCSGCAGTPTIAAMAGAASSQGTSQFGTNLVANTTPSVGANVSHGSGSSVGTAATGYDTTNSFKFNSGDTIANTGSAPSDFDTFTVSYIANISAVQKSGNYTTTITYICTSTY